MAAIKDLFLRSDINKDETQTSPSVNLRLRKDSTKSGYLINYSPAILNGGFESGYNSVWFVGQSGSSTVSEETSDTHSGAKAAKFIFVDNFVDVYQDILTVGIGYTVSCWMKTVSGNGDFTFSIGSGTTKDIPTTGSWAYYEFSGIAAGSTLFIISKGGGVGTLLVDDVRVSEIPPPNPSTVLRSQLAQILAQ